MGHRHHRKYTFLQEKCNQNKALYHKANNASANQARRRYGQVTPPIARQLSDFKRTQGPFVKATAEAFWQALDADLLPRRD